VNSVAEPVDFAWARATKKWNGSETLVKNHFSIYMCNNCRKKNSWQNHYLSCEGQVFAECTILYNKNFWTFPSSALNWMLFLWGGGGGGGVMQDRNRVISHAGARAVLSDSRRWIYTILPSLGRRRVLVKMMRLHSTGRPVLVCMVKYHFWNPIDNQ
jgi:hypothetical protein